VAPSLSVLSLFLSVFSIHPTFLPWLPLCSSCPSSWPAGSGDVLDVGPALLGASDTRIQKRALPPPGLPNSVAILSGRLAPRGAGQAPEAGILRHYTITRTPLCSRPTTLCGSRHCVVS
jgi:hypothetical protein